MSLLNKSAPDFKLFNTQKKEVSLSELRGKNVVILFFPFAFSGTCTKELCYTRDNMSVFSSLNAEVLGISTDAVFALIRYKEEQQLNIELLSDFNKDTSAAYGSLYETFIFGTRGVSMRSAFVIDQHGVVRYEEIMENASTIPDFKKIEECLAELNSQKSSS